MTPQLAGLQLALVTFVLFTGTASAAAWLIARHVLATLASLPPAVAATRLRGLLAMPAAVGALLTLVAFLPSIAASLAEVHHHCTSHVGHPHLCVVHVPEGPGSVAGWLVVATAVVAAIARAAPVLAELWRGSRLLARLRPFAASGRTVTLASPEPLCAVVGLWTPTVVVSSGFTDGMGPEALGAAIAHEAAHARRRDSLWALVMRLAAVAHAPATARALLAALELATERACDEEAGAEVGDRLLVADAILRARRLGLRRWTALASSFGPGHWAARVDALLEPVATAPEGLRRWDVLAAASAIVAIAGAGPIHHAAETALALIAH